MAIMSGVAASPQICLGFLNQSHTTCRTMRFRTVAPQRSQANSGLCAFLKRKKESPNSPIRTADRDGTLGVFGKRVRRVPLTVIGLLLVVFNLLNWSGNHR